MEQQPPDGVGAGTAAQRAPAARITDRDRRLLRFLADHRLIMAEQVSALLGVSLAAAQARLRALTRAGLVRRKMLFHRRPACYQIARQGLAAIGSELPPPRVDLRCYDHDRGVAWLWLAAHAGTWGPMQEVFSERALRSQDRRAERPEPEELAGTPDESGLAGGRGPVGVRLGGVGPGGRERLHYPDLLLITPEGRRVAIELELSSKGRTRREKILSGYAADGRLDAVLYLVEDPRLGESVRTSAARLGVSHLVCVQPVR